MLASILSCIIIVLLTYYIVFKQGLFSAVINTVAAIMAAIAAINLGETLAAIPIAARLGAYGPGAIMMVVFIILLFIIREIVDRLARNNMIFPQMIDRAGSAVVGLIYSMVIVGVVLIGLQMLPIGNSFLMYDRYSQDNDRLEQGSGLFPYADSFVLCIMEHASENGLAGKNNFSQQHPDYLRELYLQRTVLTPGSRQTASDGAVSINSTQTVVPDKRTATWFPEPPTDNTYLIVNVTIHSGTDDDTERGARDVDGKIRFVMGDFRLLGYDTTDRNSPAIERFPLGVPRLNSNGDVVDFEPIPLKQGKAYEGDAELALLYHWPARRADNSRLEPAPIYLEFKNSERTEFPRQTAPAAQ